MEEKSVYIEGRHANLIKWMTYINIKALRLKLILATKKDIENCYDR